MSRIADVADAVVDVLNDGDFTPTFTAVRVYRPTFTAPELADLQVTVAPAASTAEIETRGTNRNEVGIDVAVQQKLTATDNDTVDPLVDLAESIADYFQRQRLDSYEGAILVRTETDPLLIPEHLDQERVFTAVVRLTFRLWS